jgi:hypothetical protein
MDIGGRILRDHLQGQGNAQKKEKVAWKRIMYESRCREVTR